LTGEWRLSRSIDDGSSMAGTAAFTPNGAGQFDYREQGHFRLPDGRMIDAERRYIFEETESGFAVFFAGTPRCLFHRIMLGEIRRTLVGTGTHLCGDDHYDSRYEFGSDCSFVVEHRVRGPRKRYVMVTWYARTPLV
jgi:uncharacterized protein DUF6314